MAGGGSGSSKTTTTPWAGQQPYLTDLFQNAQQNYQSGGPQYFPDATYVPFAPQTQQALAMTEQRAMGSPTESAFNNYLQNSLGQGQYNLDPAAYGSTQAIGGLGAGQSALMQQANPFVSNMAGMQGLSALGQTANGSMLNSNPYLDQMFGSASQQLTNQYQNTVNPSIAAMFGGAGRTGSEAEFGALGDAAGQYGQALSGLASNIYGNNYANERTNQLNAANSLTNLYQSGQNNQLQAGNALSQAGLGGINALGGLYGDVSADQARAGAFAPSASQLDWNNIQQLMGAGNTIQGQAGNILQDAMNRYNFGQQAPQQALQNYAQLIYGLPGSYGVQNTQGGAGSPTSGAIGGGLAGAAAGAYLGSVVPGIGTAIGALGGGLLGAFGGYHG